MTVARVVFLAVVFAAGVVHTHGALSNSKLSVQTAFAGGTAAWTFITGGQPRVVKLLDSFSNAGQIKAKVPGVTIVGRIYQPDQPQTGDPKAAALHWWGSVNATVLANPDVDYWEGYNEPSVGQVSEVQWYAAFEQARVAVLAAHGVRASIGNFGVGTPDVTNSDAMNAFSPAVAAGVKAGAIMGAHEYASPTMQCGFDNSTGLGWFTGRYRRWYDGFLKPQGIVIPLVISEAGIDNTGACGSPDLGGWQAYKSWWQQNLPNHPADANAEYVQQLAWYDSVLRADSYVLGATLFCLEISGWAAYDVTPAVPDLVQYMTAQ